MHSLTAVTVGSASSSTAGSASSSTAGFANFPTIGSTRGYIESKEHRHQLISAGFTYDRCETIEILMCSDENCGYWQKSILRSDHSRCDMHEIKYSTHSVCYECSKCKRRFVDS